MPAAAQSAWIESVSDPDIYNPLKELELPLRRRIPRERLRMGARFLSRRQLGV